MGRITRDDLNLMLIVFGAFLVVIGVETATNGFCGGYGGCHPPDYSSGLVGAGIGFIVMIAGVVLAIRRRRQRK